MSQRALSSFPRWDVVKINGDVVTLSDMSQLRGSSELVNTSQTHTILIAIADWCLLDNVPALLLRGRLTLRNA